MQDISPPLKRIEYYYLASDSEVMSVKDNKNPFFLVYCPECKSRTSCALVRSDSFDDHSPVYSIDLGNGLVISHYHNAGFELYVYLCPCRHVFAEVWYFAGCDQCEWRSGHEKKP